MRCFIAIDIPENIKDEIYYLIQVGQKKFNLPVKWVERENLHITLHFLGEVGEEIIEKIKESLLQVKNFDYKISLNDIGSFPEKGLPRILWLGFKDETGNIIKAYKFLYDSLSLLGLELDKREFKPHITIGRCKKIMKSELSKFNEMVSELRDGIKKIDSFFESKGANLYKSELFPKGPVYTKIF